MNKLEVNEKSKKSDILNAYQEILKKMKNQETLKVSEKTKQTEEKKVVEQAKSQSSESIIAALATTKTQLGKALDEIEEAMLASFKKFFDLQKSIEVSKQDFESIHQITVEADTLVAFVQTHQEMKQQLDMEIQKRRLDLEQEISERKELWEKEKQAYEGARQEEERYLKKLKKREEEDYQYALNLERQKDCDTYEIKKTNLERELQETKERTLKELADKETHLVAQEKELVSLREQVANFPTHLASEVDKGCEQSEIQVRAALQFQIELSQKEMEGERKLYEQKVSSLEAKIKELESQIVLLNKKSDEAGKQAQGIALKAIEGASKHSFYPFEPSGSKSSTD